MKREWHRKVAVMEPKLYVPGVFASTLSCTAESNMMVEDVIRLIRRVGRRMSCRCPECGFRLTADSVLPEAEIRELFTAAKQTNAPHVMLRVETRFKRHCLACPRCGLLVSFGFPW